MTSGLWPATPSDLAEGARIEMGGKRVADFLALVMARLQAALAEQGFVVQVPILHVADSSKGVASRRVAGDVTTRAGELTGMRVTARLTAVMNPTGPKALSLSLQLQAEDGGPLPFLTTAPMTEGLKLQRAEDATSGFMMREALAAMTVKCETVTHAQMARQFCEKLTHRLAP